MAICWAIAATAFVDPGMSFARASAMIQPLHGQRIALLESRFSSEFAELVHRLGGEAVVAPAVDAVPCHNDIRVFIDALTHRRVSIAIFLTGEGPETLFNEAERRGVLREVVDALRQVTIVCRGAKPLGPLKARGIRPHITTARPHTTHELLGALATVDVEGRGVLLVHSGDSNWEVATALRQRGARLTEVCPYTLALPADLAPISSVVREAIASRIDAVLFTSQAQCRHLFEVAGETSQAEGLALSLNRRVVVGAIGPVCARELQRAGITADIIPRTPSMPALLDAVAEYFEAEGARATR
jgi:uroporphyrinogen-III synthase